MARVVLNIGDDYIGSAFSPIVDITENEQGHVVTITDYDGDHSYLVPDWSGEESERVANENARISAENARAAAEQARESAETSRETAEAAREAAEGEREETFTTNEAARQATFEEAESERASAETGRVAAETARASAESSRAFAEATRASNESARVSAESSRASAETARASAESSRASAESSRASAESTRVSNESSRQSAETSRASAETARASAESARASAESGRVSAESSRVSAESSRVNAESGRVAAENERVAYYEGFESVIDHKAEIDGYVTELVAGASENLTPRETSEQSFMFRASQASDDTVAGIECIKGNTVRWNQLVDRTTPVTANWSIAYASGTTIKSGNKYLLKYYLEITQLGTAPPSVVPYCYVNGTVTSIYNIPTRSAGWNAAIFTSSVTATSNGTTNNVEGNTWIYNSFYGSTASITNIQLFDLTAMFGAGNEPATVAEFEALFPESYYAYDAGSLLNVEMVGVEGVGFNQWDEEWELGTFNDSGTPVASTSTIRSKNYIPVFAGTTYYFRAGGVDAYVRVAYYDSAKTLIGFLYGSGGGIHDGVTFTTPANTSYMRFGMGSAYGTTYNHDICINVSGELNGEYRPYVPPNTREIDVSEWFEGGMKSAANASAVTVSDELTNDAAVQRIGAVDLGILTWSYYNNRFNANLPNDVKVSSVWNSIGLNCAQMDLAFIGPNEESNDRHYGVTNGVIYVRYNSITTAAAFKDAMSGVMLYYELATPTVTPIDPPLNLTFKSYEGGTERILVDTTQSAPQSAPPRLLMGYGDTAKTIRDKALSVIAMVEKAKATANHAVNTYLIFNGKLYKVTSAIATGETIAPGTNVTETTVMAEILARL